MGMVHSVLGIQSFSLSCNDAYDKDGWMIENKEGNRLTQVYMVNGH